MDEAEIFWRAIEQHRPDSWDSFLQSACEGDRALHGRVAELLAAHQQQHPLLEVGSLLSSADAPFVLERPGHRIGRYKLLEEIGEGGFGIIFLAEQVEPIRRQVALKILKPGVDTRQVIARFEAERQALAMMDHPNIAQVHDAGVAPSGRPFFVMELVRGLPITEYCRRFRLTIKERLQLTCDVCHAIEHAHMKGIIHRDLKPSNILVTRADGQSVVKVIDFGIAKATGPAPLTEKTLVTGLTQFVGTPAYMSPEQALRNGVDVDTRSDVYSLGILLYELLTGRPPFEHAQLSDVGYDEFRRRICEVDPPVPSLRLAVMHDSDPTAAGEDTRDRSTDHSDSNRFALGLRPSTREAPISRELDWIVMRALEKDRGRRFQSAAALAADIKAFLNDEPVSVGPPSTWYRLEKCIRRHRVVVTATAIVATALILATAFSLRQAHRANSARQLADERLRNEMQARRDLLLRETKLRRQLYADDLTNAWQAWKSGAPSRTRELLDQYLPDQGSEDPRDFTWQYLRARSEYQSESLTQHSAPVLTATLSPDGRFLASGDQAGTIKIWDNDQAREVASWRQSSREITHLAFSPDGRFLAIAGQEPAIQLRTVADWSEYRTLSGHTRTVTSLSWAPDGRQLVSGSRDKSIRVWDVESGEERRRLINLADVVRCVLWLQSGDQIVAAVGNTIQIQRPGAWDEPQILARQPGGILSASASPDGRLLAVGGYSRYVVIIELASGQEWGRLFTTGIWSMSFSPDGQYLLAGSGAGGPIVWKLHHTDHQVELIRTAADRRGTQRSVIWDAHRSRVLTASEEGQSISGWDNAELLGYQQRSLYDRCLAIDESMDAMIGCNPRGEIVHRSFTTGEERARWRAHAGNIHLARISSTRRRLATFADDDEVSVWDLATGRLCWRSTAPGSNTPESVQLSFSPDGRSLMLAGSSSSIRVWHAEDGTVDRDLFADVEDGKLLAISPLGDYFAAVTGRSFAHLFRFPSFTPATTIRISPQCWDVKFTPQGRHLVAASGIDGTFVLTVPELNVQWQMLPDQGNSRLLAISPDGRIVANLYGDGLVRLWDLATGRELFSPTPRLEFANWIEFTSPTRLVIACGPRDSSEPGTQHLYVLNAQPPITKNVSRNPPRRKDFDVYPWRPVDMVRPAPVGKDTRRPQQRLVDR